MRNLIGIDIGGTKTAVCLGHDDGEILARAQFWTTEAGGPYDVLALAASEGLRLLGQAGLGKKDVAAVGVACGGPLDSRLGIVQSPPNLPGWDEIQVVSHLESLFDGTPTYLFNDADACALAERLWGAGQDCESFAYLTFGTGLGAGLFLGGRLFSGACGLAGEIGHVRVEEDGPVGHNKAGSLEGFASGGAMPDLLRRLAVKDGSGSRLAEQPELTAQDIAEAARGGDPLAVRTLQVCGEYLGRGIAILVDLLNLDKVIIGGMYPRDREIFEPHAMEAMRREALTASGAACAIVPPGLGERVGDLAALAAATGVESGRASHASLSARGNGNAAAEHLNTLVKRYPNLTVCTDSIRGAFEIIQSCYAGGNKLLICGNGGSAADGDHIAGELLKGFLKKRPLPEDIRRALRAAGPDGGRIADLLQGGLPTIALNGHPALISAFANDVDPTLVFAQQVLALTRAGDVLLAISTSGNSANVVAALQTARGLGVGTLGLTGQAGGRMSEFCDVCICVPEVGTAEVQELHLPVYHTLCAMLEEAFFTE